jgi:hypothetical protein
MEWVLLGGFMLVIYPVCVAHANERMPAALRLSFFLINPFDKDDTI